MVWTEFFDFCQDITDAFLNFADGFFNVLNSTVGEFVAFVIEPLLPPIIREAFLNWVDSSGLSDIGMVSFLFGSTLITIFAIWLIKWTLDIVK